MKEIWKDIKGYEGLYQVSNLGRVFKIKSNIIHLGCKGIYASISLRKNKISRTYPVHFLVAQAFIPNPNKYKEINHIDGNKRNNIYTNLEWCSHKENMQHSIRTGLRKKQICAVALLYKGKEIMRFDSLLQAQRETKGKYGNAYYCIKGLRKHKQKDYEWVRL